MVGAFKNKSKNRFVPEVIGAKFCLEREKYDRSNWKKDRHDESLRC